MPRFFLRIAAAPAMGGILTLSSLGIAACSSADKTTDSAAAARAAVPAPMATATSTPDSMAGMQRSSQGMQGVQGMTNMSGDPDQNFLRMMSDHHKGLILLAHMTKERKEGGAAVVDAKKVDTKQDAELDKMMGMLEKSYKDAYAPKTTPEHQAMADDLKTKRGKEYDQTFYQDIVKHHKEAIKMVDDYLPRGKSAAVKQMAEKMKADQTREIREFEQKASQLKG
jgi:uncharacterized protein (DUF305 family)